MFDYDACVPSDGRTVMDHARRVDGIITLCACPVTGGAARDGDEPAVTGAAGHVTAPRHPFTIDRMSVKG
ncbi:hypothetical protein [Dactylosporangium darangshiense]|uniref:Uncharacterized protein n=1 Tax=Dactylosporangium darangshiense TaxID=579108 RepID=A0ABP8DAT3_9ACTN